MSSDLLERICGEIDARLRELRPVVAEYEELLAVAGPSANSSPRRSSAKSRAGQPKRQGGPDRAPRGAAQHAIVAALGHGSHTVAELVVVTAMPAANIRQNLRRLVKAGTVSTARREGKAAYALASPPV
jgi:predicted Rossmann fold nucleotide-binding protein DprA/Smf involved in DNA uptake